MESERERAETPLKHYFPSIKSTDQTSSINSKDLSSSRLRRRKNPKQLTLAEATEQLYEKQQSKGGGGGDANELNLSLNKVIRSTLGKEDNPVTNSTSYSRTLHVQSNATGHQGGGGGASGRGWALHRNAKLAIQAAEKETDTLRGVVGYISGYTGDVTNLELRACVERQGGRMLPMANGGCTHIFSTSNLSGSKAQKYFESNKKNKFKLVLPEWAFECEKRGKRVAEARFIAPIKHELQGSIFEIYKSDNSASTSTSTSAASLLASTSTSPQPRKRPQISTVQEEDASTKNDSNETIILSPSPSPKSPAKKRKSSTKVTTDKTKRRSTSNSPKSVSKKRKEEKKKIEELLILGSSDVEIEDPSLAKKVQRPGKETARKRVEELEEDEEELDEFGMPPSAQRR